MGGYFLGRPMKPESGPVKTKKAQSRVALQATWAGQGTSRPARHELAEGKGHGKDWSPNTTQSTNLEGMDLE